MELRRYTAKPIVAKEYYSELPFDLELDGPYYSMLNFFDRVGKLERLVNISGLLVSNTKNPKAQKRSIRITYAPNESVVATFTATTFFSHDLEPAGAAPGAKPDRRGQIGIAMKLTTGILAVGLMTGGLWAQNPNIINNVQSTMKTVQQKKTDDSNAALGISSTPPASRLREPPRSPRPLRLFRE